jgi:hypothetical protein
MCFLKKKLFFFKIKKDSWNFSNSRVHGKGRIIRKNPNYAKYSTILYRENIMD